MDDKKVVIGGIAGVPNPKSDFAQTDPTKADFVKNKKMSYIENDVGYVTRDDIGDIGTGNDLILTSDIGRTASISDSIEAPIVGANIYGESTQDGMPTPDAPADIVNIDNPTITLSDENGNTQSVTLKDVTLRGIKELDGIYSARDEIVVEDGLVKLVQNIGIKIFDGKESFSTGLFSSAWGYSIPDTTRLKGSNFIVSHFSNVKLSSNTWGAFIVGNSAQGIGFYTNNAPFTTKEEFGAWLAGQYANGTPVILYYVLAKPVVTDITETAQQTLELFTYYPTTTVNCTGDCSITYKADLTNAYNNIPKNKWELISSGELTEEVSSLTLNKFDCSKISLRLAVVATATNSGDSALQLRTNANTAAGGGSNTKLTRVFRATAYDPIIVQIDINATPTTLKGQLWCSSGAESFYTNPKHGNSITALYLTPATSGYVFGVGSTYELWGVRN